MFQTEQGPNKIRNVGGPHNLGDPEDRTLRRVEKEVLIPKIMRERAKTEKCVDAVKAFESCCKDNNIFMVFKCRDQNNALKSCLEEWYQNEQFQNECKEIYLQERSEFRRTGLSKKKRQAMEAEKK
ncbi:unnamed protein product [Hermetia illucens]|uniref:COX assembly mitochondrial protein n=1 Tax=Hermetia illucens TaxID=343691 RepID=A0A7R8UGC0_HERIL|nr:COX assembly mitochondrial protein homolog [Hermetia illucens]CAD7080089.1 unnamed protein product [Hermetia illucens]